MSVRRVRFTQPGAGVSVSCTRMPRAAAALTSASWAEKSSVSQSMPVRMWVAPIWRARSRRASRPMPDPLRKTASSSTPISSRSAEAGAAAPRKAATARAKTAMRQGEIMRVRGKSWRRRPGIHLPKRRGRGLTPPYIGTSVHDLSRGRRGRVSFVTSAVNGTGVLTVSSDANDAITITSVGGDVKVNGGNPAGGPAVDSADITAIDVSGGPGANNINLAGVNATDFPQLADGTDVTVDGGEGNDTINGSLLADHLEGGNGDDRIISDDSQLNSRDELLGEGGNDTMVWNPCDDDDDNDGGPGNDTVEVNGGGGGEVFEVKASAIPGRVAFDRTGPNPPGPFNLDIGTSERLDPN